MKVLLATTNKAKIKNYAERLKEKGIDIVTLNELNISCDVDETGKNPVENAIIKATAYNKISNIPTIALDDGLFFENVGDELQPGTNVRRVNGKRLNDDEMIEYYMNLVKEFGEAGKLRGYFLKGVAIVDGENTYTFDYKAERCFANTRSEIINEGYPLASIQFVESLNKFKSELSAEEEAKINANEQKDIMQFIEDTIVEIEKMR